MQSWFSVERALKAGAAHICVYQAITELSVSTYLVYLRAAGAPEVEGGNLMDNAIAMVH